MAPLSSPIRSRGAILFGHNALPLMVSVGNLIRVTSSGGYPSVSLGASGQFAIAWRTSNQTVMASRFESDGTPLEYGFAVGTTKNTSLLKTVGDSVTDDNNLLVAFTGTSDIISVNEYLSAAPLEVTGSSHRRSCHCSPVPTRMCIPTASR